VESAPPYYLLGPTAVGKSDLAVALAEQCDGEIVGADAFQVYAGLDLLTAKPSAALRARVPHHLMSEVPLTQPWDVAQWLAAAQRRVAEIQARGRRAIIVGGTGLYIRAITRGLATLPAASVELRAELAAEQLPELQRRLVELDPVGARTIDLKNPRRVIRALEVCLLTNRPFSSFREQWSTAAADGHGIVLLRPRDELYRRIDERTEAMFAEGVIEEVRAAGEVGPTASQALGLREIRAHLGGELTRAECIAAIQQATRRYAKRQLTWFRREAAFQPVDLSALADPAALIEQLVREIRAS
jgi:tRNA dimethylallyltransferase